MYLASLLFSGCASIPVTQQLPIDLRLAPVGRIDPHAPFAWHPKGDAIACVRGTLRIQHLVTGKVTEIAAAPSAIAWSPDGGLLAAASGQGETTRILIYDEQGAVMDETVIPARVAQIAWRSANELIAATLSLVKFKFGSNLSGQLYRWKRGESPSATTLFDATIMPARAHRQLQSYLDSFSFSLSPFADEIAFTRFVEPPNFPSYQKLVVRHLASGAEKEASEEKNEQAGAVYLPDGEHLLYGGGAGTVRQFAPWTGGYSDLLATPGKALAVSPSGRYLFADGRLYLDGAEVVSFPSGCGAAFSPDGSRLLLRCEESLSLLSGLKQLPLPDLPPAGMESLLKLRRWRSEGLITDQEYRSSKQGILNQ